MQYADLARQFGTPLYLFDSEVIQRQYQRLSAALGPGAEIFYSLKANGNASIAALLRRCGSCAEVASLGELLLAQTAGFAPENILFSGPGKTVEELTAAVQAGLFCIMAESAQEVRRLSAIGGKLGRTARIGVRINPHFKPPKAALVMGGEKQFGIDEDEIDGVIAEIKTLPNLELVGIHIYAGTQVLDSGQLVQYFADVQATVAAIAQRNQVHFSLVDTGGGMGIAYGAPEKELDLAAAAPQIQKILGHYQTLFPGCRVGVESGRYLLAPGGTYVCQVQYKKQIKGHTYLVVDGGLHQCSLASFQGKLYRRNPHITVEPCRNERETVSIAGPLCTPEDLLAHHMELPAAQPGDYVCIHQMGAYGLSYSPVHFLGHPAPAEVLVHNGTPHLIRKPARPEDILLNQCVFTE